MVGRHLGGLVPLIKPQQWFMEDTETLIIYQTPPPPPPPLTPSPCFRKPLLIVWLEQRFVSWDLCVKFQEAMSLWGWSKHIYGGSSRSSKLHPYPESSLSSPEVLQIQDFSFKAIIYSSKEVLNLSGLGLCKNNNLFNLKNCMSWCRFLVLLLMDYSKSLSLCQQEIL